MEGQRLAFEAIDHLTRPTTFGGASKTDLGIEVEDQRQFGHQTGDRHGFQFGQHAPVELAEYALIDPRRIDETIADHPFAALKRRADQAVDMVDPGGREHQRLGERAVVSRLPRQDHLTDRLGLGRAAGLARRPRREACRLEAFAQRARQRRLAGALPAFERDEMSLVHLGLISSGSAPCEPSLSWPRKGHPAPGSASCRPARSRPHRAECPAS